MRRIHLLVALAGLALLLPLAASSASSFPARIDLPDGFQPEGIAIGKGTTFYVGSIPTGRIWRGNLRTGQGSVVVPDRGRRAIGIDIDNRKRLFVAGGPLGSGYVYNARTGADIAQYTFTTETSFVNDVVVTRTAAWFTDSARQFIYKVPIGRRGQLGAAQAIPLTGDIVYTTGFNANGVEATRNGRTLIIVQSNTGKLFTVNRQGVTNEIDLGGATVAGDGLLLHGKALYVVVRSPVDGIAVVRLSRDLSSGTVVRTITKTGLDDPTTIDKFGRSLYAVNARFSTPPGPDVEYWVTRLRK
ncbi:MAG: superoxide dismutase [Gaiellaceae bacterium]